MSSTVPTLGKKARWFLLTVLTAIVALLIAWIALRGKQLGPLASAVLQSATLVLSIYGAIVFTREGNDQHIRAVARASARRVLINYEALGRLATSTSDMRMRMRSYGRDKGSLDAELVDTAITGLEDQIFIQILTADAAIQDWRDLAPAEVDEEVNQVRERRRSDD